MAAKLKKPLKILKDLAYFFDGNLYRSYIDKD